LAAELATEGKDIRARQVVSFYLKNLLVAKVEALQTAKHEAWKNLAPEARAWRSPENTGRHTSEVVAIDLPFNEWPQFLPMFLENVSSEQHSEGIEAFL
jgi:hypothetical protein